MPWSATTLWILALTAALSAALGPIIVRLGPTDRPRDRGLHQVPTPTSGGLAIMLSVALGIALSSLLSPGATQDAPYAAGLLLIAALFGLVGAIDDWIDLPPLPRLLGQLTLAAGLCILVARVETLPIVPGLILPVGPVFGFLGCFTWLIILWNGFNFVDGANGVALGLQTIALMALGIIAAPAEPSLSLLFLVAAAAHAGFLPWNLPFGKVFQGDCGALFGGVMIAGGVVILSAQGACTPWFGGFITLPILIDVCLTLVVRYRLKRRLFEPHREHLYQIWLTKTGKSHAALSVRLWGLSLASTALGLWSEHQTNPWFSPLPVLLTLTALLIGAWIVTRMRLTRSRPFAA